MSTLNTLVLIFGYCVLVLAIVRVLAGGVLDTIVVVLRVRRILTDKAMLAAYVALMDEADTKPKEKTP